MKKSKQYREEWLLRELIKEKRQKEIEKDLGISTLTLADKIDRLKQIINENS